VSGIAAPVQREALRRVLRLRSLNSGPYLMEHKPERHEPVMVEEILDTFQLRPGAVVVDGTLGLGGHSQRFLEKIAPEGMLIGFDWDASMMVIAKDRLVTLGHTELALVNKDFREIEPVLEELHVKADAILLDLGLNSAQLDDPHRGLSFLKDGPLDMRMDRTRGEPASAVLNRMSPLAIETVLKEYGDERWARAIARVIVERRKTTPLRTTTDLANCVLAAIPKPAQDKRIHPATRTFQAVRIYVNRELEGLDDALQGAVRSLAPGGVLAVLSYHSGEDRIVKHTFRDLAEEGYQELFKKPIAPTEAEERRNPRSRSAKLRAITRPLNGEIA
jgi:16S rRNA (cytosine1402-N4)-methyltransferase